MFFSYDPDIFPNGVVHASTSVAFSDNDDYVTFHYVVSDFIYHIDKSNRSVQCAYKVNFGEKASRIDLSVMTSPEILTYLEEHKNTACIVDYVIETPSILHFTYALDFKRYHAFYDKNSGAITEGVLINDLFDSDIRFLNHADNKLIGIMIPEKGKISAKVSDYIETGVLSRIEDANILDGNPFIVVIELK